MLIQFSCENFGSICSNVTLSMKIPEQDYEGSILEDSRLIENQYSRVAEIYGANGTGKTTILTAIYVMATLVRISNNDYFISNKDFSIGKYYNPHKRKINESTLFYIYFIKNNRKYYYELSYLGNSFKTEKLYYQSDKSEKKLDLIFEKIKNGYDIGHDFKNILNDSKKDFKTISKKLQENELLLSVAGTTNLNNEIIKDAYDFITNDIVLYQAQTIKERRRTSIDILRNNDDIKRKYIEFMQTVDKTFETFEIDSDNENNYIVKNKYKNFDDYIPLTQESSGIQNMFDSMSLIFSVLNDGKVLICDEWERTFHPLIIKELIKKFLYKSLKLKHKYTGH